MPQGNTADFEKACPTRKVFPDEKIRPLAVMHQASADTLKKNKSFRVSSRFLLCFDSGLPYYTASFNV